MNGPRACLRIRGPRSCGDNEAEDASRFRGKVRLLTSAVTIFQTRALAAELGGATSALCWLLLASVGTVATSCSWNDRHGTHHLILRVGFGLITTTNRAGVDASDAQVLGLAVGHGTVSSGWVHQRTVQIDPGLASNLVISVSSSMVP